MTLPFTAAREAALKETLQSGKLAMLKQWRDTPQFHCCISGNTVGVAKDPVGVIVVDDRVVCIGEDVIVDITDSYSPTDTLAGQAYNIDWGDVLEPDTNGNFPNPYNPPAVTETLVGGYTSVGFRMIVLSVVDTLGATSVASLQIYVRDCSLPEPVPPFQETIPPVHEPWNMYGELVFGIGSAFYTTTFHQAAPVWSAVSDAAGLTATEIQQGWFVMDSDGTERIYAVDINKVFSHPMPPDTGEWRQLATATQLQTPSGIVLAGATAFTHSMANCVTKDGWQWVTWTYRKASLPKTDQVIGVAMTKNSWRNITHSSEIVRITNDPFVLGLYARVWGIDVVQQSGGQILYAAVGLECDPAYAISRCALYRSNDYGQNWFEVDRITGAAYYPDVWIPYAGSGDIVYWGNYEELRMGRNGVFSSLANIPWNAYPNSFWLSGPWNRKDICTIHTQDKLWEYRAGNLTQITPNLPGGPSYGHLVQTRVNPTGAAEATMWVGGSGANPNIKVNEGGGQTSKEGTWAAGLPYAVTIPELREFAT